MLHLDYFITNKTGDFSKYFLFKGIYCLGNPLRSTRIHTYMHIHVCIHTHRHIHHRSSTWFSGGIPHPGWLEHSMYSVLCQETFLRWFYFFMISYCRGRSDLAFYFDYLNQLPLCISVSVLSGVVALSKFCLLNVHQLLFLQAWLIMNSVMRWNMGSSYISPWIQPIAWVFLNSKWFHWYPENQPERCLTQWSTESNHRDHPWNKQPKRGLTQWSTESSGLTTREQTDSIKVTKQRARYFPSENIKKSIFPKALAEGLFPEGHGKKCSGWRQML